MSAETMHAQEGWTRADAVPNILPGEIHLWRLCPQLSVTYPTDLYSVLSLPEQDRAHRFCFTPLRDQFVQAHGVLRLLLAEALQTSPSEIEFTVGEFGKPSLAEGGVAFNISHTNGLTLIALSSDIPLGIDTERVRPATDLIDLAQSSFSTKEHTKLLALAAGDLAPAFFRCWTRKEAFLKAIGLGISQPLSSFEVSLLESEPAAILGCAWDALAASRWSLRHLEPLPGFVGALAYEAQTNQPPITIKQWQWTEHLQQKLRADRSSRPDVQYAGIAGGLP